jgi:hypothetical protein
MAWHPWQHVEHPRAVATTDSNTPCWRCQVHRAIVETQGVRDRHDLMGATVVTSSGYADLMARYNMRHVKSMPW